MLLSPPPRRALRTAVRLAAAIAVACGVAAPVAEASPAADPFTQYDSAPALAELAPGTVLRTRVRLTHIGGAALPIRLVQLLYRSEDAQHRPVANVTSILIPPGRARRSAVSFQSAYDSLNPADGPSRVLAGGRTLGGTMASAEIAPLLPLLLDGYPIVVPDTEGQEAHFLAGPEYGMHTLNSLRAATRSPATGLGRTTPIAMIGYSGGAIATEWAAELAPQYAPDLSPQLVGASLGGLLVHPANSLRYVSGSAIWASGIPMALVGVARSFDLDFSPYLNDFGRRLTRAWNRASILEVLAHYPGMTWARIAKPAYADPRSVPEYVEAMNRLIMGTGGTPQIPLDVFQGAGGASEGTAANAPGAGPGDGIMRLADARALMRQYCAAGTVVDYHESATAGHVAGLLLWTPRAVAWAKRRLAGVAPANTCAAVPNAPALSPIEPLVDGR